MKIHALKFHNKSREWLLQRTTFRELTLLVGISGVGKTQILDSIMALKRIARGRNAQGLEWEMEFSTNGDLTYVWQGEFEQLPAASDSEILVVDSDDEESQPKANVVYERLYLNGELVVNRSGDDILLRGDRTPKLSRYESVLSILNREAEISPAHAGFGNIIHSDQVGSARATSIYRLANFEKLLLKYTSLEDIQQSELETFWKLALVYHHDLPVFSAIRDKFIDIFPQVADVKLDADQSTMFLLGKLPVLQIREHGVGKWILQRDISSGMFRTIIQLAEVFLSPSGTVVLVDEFENSLGINCIDVLTEDLLYYNRRMQFIVTSHHPYIINNISPTHWKVVRRIGGIVRTEDASDLGIAESSHEAFLQLINSEEYRNGIAAA